MFGPAMHPELVKRASDVLVFMVAPPACALEPQHIVTLWEACVSQHGALAVPIAECLCEIVPSLSAALLQVGAWGGALCA